MRKIKMFFVAMALLATSLVYAQNQAISGKIVDASTGETVPFASVVVKNTMNGTASDAQGNYSINASAKATLVFSAIGYKTTEVVVDGKSKISVKLTPDAEFLDDVIVVAYGTASRQSLTGAVTAIDSKTIEQTISTSATAALEGVAPGVQVNSTYGEPGTDPTIRIRGFGSVTGSNAPLYVVDGFPYNGNVSDINSNDIESISVLKDANAAALYGNRAANGVVLITTKKSKADGKPIITFTTNHGAYTRGTDQYNRLTADDWMKVQWQGYKNSLVNNPDNPMSELEAREYATENLVGTIIKRNIYNAPDNEVFDTEGNLVAQRLSGYDDLDWTKAAEKVGYRRQYGLSFASNTDKYNVYSSLDYTNEDGYVINTGFERFAGRINSAFTPVSWFKAGVNLAASKTTRNFNGNANSTWYANTFYTTSMKAPVYPIYLHNADGSYLLDEKGNKQFDLVSDYLSNRHIIYERLNDWEKNSTLNVDASAFATIILPYGFDVTVKGNKLFKKVTYNQYENPNIGDGATNNGRFSVQDTNYETTTFQQQINWAQNYGKHHVDALLAHETYKYDYDYSSFMNSNMSLEGIYVPGNFSENSSLPTGFSFSERTESYLVRARYNYAEKYFFEGNFRRDGSSRLSSGSRWGNFWSVGGSWVISKENFMKNATGVDYLKLRASYGTAGNLGGIDLYAYQALYQLDAIAGSPALFKLQLSAEDLKWETTNTLDVAVEGRFFDRLNAQVGYFNKVSDNLLFDVPLASSAGHYIWGSTPYMTQLSNIGSVLNAGWEIAFDVDAIRTKDWKWNIGADITFLNNKVLTLPNHEDIANGIKRFSEGHSIYEFYTYHFAGVSDKTGRSLYTIDPEKVTAAEAAGEVQEIGGVKYTTDAAKYGIKDWVGSALPVCYGGIHTDLSWKGLTLHILATYSLGGKVYDSNYATLMGTASNSMKANHADLLNSWNGSTTAITDPDVFTANGIPAIDNYNSQYNNTTSDRWLTSASYFTLKNITLSYAFSDKVLKTIGLKGLTVNAGIENVVTATSRQGLNPSYSFSGGQDFTYVAPRIFNIGAVLKF